MEIRSKAQFFDLWNTGCLGFKLRAWDDPQAAVAAGVPLVGFRQIGTGGGGRFVMATRDHILETADQLTREGIRFMICEAAPDEQGTIQGEVCRTSRGLEGYLGMSTGLRMREAMARGLLTPRGYLETLALCRHFMSAPSFDDLEALFDLYPDSTVEFTCYGDHDFDRGRNTIFWEVRNY